MSKIKTALGALGALSVASFAETGSGATAPEWATNMSSDEFTSIVGEIAPIALTVVFAVAGVRVAIKLINRGAGK